MTSSCPLCYTFIGGSIPDHASIPNGDSPIGPIVPAIEANPLNASISIGLGDAKMGNHTGYTLLPTWSGRLWPVGHWIRVGFTGGTLWQQDQVKGYGMEWSDYGNIFFLFPVMEPYDILVDFDPSGANFSMIGIDSRYNASRNVPSMNLGSVVEGSDMEKVRGIILHEFGHAIGLTHTMANAYPSISWNKDKVYKDLAAEPFKWSKENVDDKLFQGWSPQLAHDLGDRYSIMQYGFPNEWTKDGKGSQWNLSLSQQDKDMLTFYYPYDTQDGPGMFNSMEVRHWNNPQLLTVKEEWFQKSSEDRKMVVGLNFFDFDTAKNFRLKVSATNVQPEKFTAKLESWNDTINYMSGLTYLDLTSAGLDQVVQTGKFSSSDVRPWTDTSKTANSKRIQFEKAFTSTPKVICWLTGMDFDKGNNIRIKVYVDNIDSSGFTAHVDTWGDSKMYAGDTAWLAYPGDMPNVASGKFSTNDVRNWNQPTHDTTSKVAFATGVFSKRPKIFVAFDYLDYDKRGSICGRIALENVTPTAFQWRLQSWWDTVMYGTGCSYFAYNL